MASAPLPLVIPAAREPFLDTRTGLIARTWNLFFEQLRRNLSGAVESFVLTIGDERATFPNSLPFIPATGELERLLTTDSYTLGLADTTVTAAPYGSASKTVSVTVDAKGRVTAAAEFALSTSNITEGTNLYYTDARARAALSGGSGINYNSGSGVIATTGFSGTVTPVTSITVVNGIVTAVS